MENSEHINDVDASFSSPSGIRTKRSPSWFLDTSKPEFIPSKKQAAETESSKLSSGISFAGPPSWDNTFQTVPNQFIDRLFGSQITRPINYAERNISDVVTDNDLNARAKSVDDQYGQDITVGLSMTHGTEDPQMCLNYGGIKKVNVNQAKDNEIEMHAPIDQGPNLDNSNDLSTDHVFVNESETGFMSIGQTCNKEQDNVMLMGHSYCSGHSVGRPTSQEDNHRRGDVNIISFSFAVQQETVAVGRPVGSYDQICNHSSVQTSKAICEEDLDASNINIIMNTDRMTKPRTELVLKNKPDNKAVRKEAPNSFPSNVRSLISTGMLEGIPIKYVSLAKKELRGIIKGSGYLCACQTCKYSKVLNAYEFERHADCKTKHPNNHIYFENGKTIYQIVQELRSTPESFLFDTIKTIFGAPIDQKAFRIWKESYQAATRELQRIYGKEELNV